MCVFCYVHANGQDGGWAAQSAGGSGGGGALKGCAGERARTRARGTTECVDRARDEERI